MPRLLPAVACGCSLLLPLAACGGGGGEDEAPASTGSAAACGRPAEEALDPRSTQHLLPGAPEPEYAGDPPTSGPHESGASPPAVAREPLPRPVQVAVLERGGVVVQHREVTPDERARLEALAGDGVVVAPNPALPAPVVATAWRHRLTCSAVDLEALRRFVADRAGRGPEH